MILQTGGRFNIKMSSYQYRKSHCGDKMTLWPFHFHNRIFYPTSKASLYWIWMKAPHLTLSPLAGADSAQGCYISFQGQLNWFIIFCQASTIIGGRWRQSHRDQSFLQQWAGMVAQAEGNRAIKTNWHYAAGFPSPLPPSNFNFGGSLKEAPLHLG